MIVLNTDLDNTLIYSYKHEIGSDKINVELYNNREISFITRRTYELLNELKKKLLIIPTSTRTIEQYERINLGVGKFEYALVCNGGILLVNGKRDEIWYQDSLNRIHRSMKEIDDALRLLESDSRRSFELRFIENLFVFTKCDEPEAVVKDLKEQLDNTLVDVFHNGEKVYVVPVDLSKGIAVERFRSYINADTIIAAGDSEFDISMLKAADIGLTPYGYAEKFKINFDVREAGEKELFSEYVLSFCQEVIARQYALPRHHN